MLNFAQDISFGVAFLAGLLSFFSPCLIPMIPAYLMYITGSQLEGGHKVSRRHAFLKTLVFVGGFTVVFLIMGTSASYLGTFFAKNRILIQRLSGMVITLFGLNLLGVIKLSQLGKVVRFKTKAKENSYSGAFVLGLAFAAGWTPCFGPVLASILLYAGASGTVAKGFTLLLVYSMGMAIPFLLSAIFLTEINAWIGRFEHGAEKMTKIAGFILVVFGILVATGYIVRLGALLV
jgi:cytochrome c-type biogenesis protein